MTESEFMAVVREVRRIDDTLYFRSIQKLTRRIINHGKPLPSECPLKFTETDEAHEHATPEQVAALLANVGRTA